MDRIRVLSYNIHKGLSVFNWRNVLQEVRDVIAATGADIVCLQEIGVNSRTLSEKFASQLEFIADTAWTHFAYGRNSVYTSGHHGNAVLSRWPILSYANVNLTVSPLEKRGLLHARIGLDDQKTLDILCTHLNLFGYHRRKQVQLIRKYFMENKLYLKPLALAGDFNDWNTLLDDDIRDSLSVKEAFCEIKGRHARTFPSWMPMLPLDRIYFNHMRIVDSVCLDGKDFGIISDHLPIVCDFQL